jgi:hypothetical protein
MKGATFRIRDHCNGVDFPATADADTILGGTITAAGGEKLGGITVSAKPVGGTITTTVFTDETGDYISHRCRKKISLWAQAISFATAKADVDLTAPRKDSSSIR